MDLGTPVVTGPAGQRWTMYGYFGFYNTPTGNSDYPLDGIPPSAFTPGDWAVEAPGGRDIAAFRIPLRVPPPLAWQNRGTLPPLSGTRDLTLTWDPAGYTPRERITASASSGAAFVSCQAQAVAGSVTIPAALIAQLPRADTGMVQLLLTAVNTSPQLYTMPLVGGGAFPGVSTFSYLEAVTAVWE